eukprot:3453323-Prymnesium_polylepis.1
MWASTISTALVIANASPMSTMSCDRGKEHHLAHHNACVRWRLAAAENDSSACTSLQLFDLTRPCRECNRNIAPHQQIVPDDAA